MARAKRTMPDEAEHFDEICKRALIIRYKMIKALLEYHFNPEEGKEYIQKTLLKIPFEYR